MNVFIDLISDFYLLNNLNAQSVHIMILFAKMAKLLFSLNQEIGYDK